MRCLAIGGCHLEGYPIGFEHSYIHQLSGILGELHIEAHFPLSHVRQIPELIGQFNPRVVVLQLGNYEFDASIRKTVQFWKKRRQKKTTSIPDISVSSAAPAAAEPATARRKARPLLNNPLLNWSQWLMLPLIYSLRIAQAKDQLKTLAAIIRQHPTLKFIILTPLPLDKATDNWIRKKAAALFKKQFTSLQNAVVIDTHRTLKHPPIFTDPSHLNKTGHVLLQHAIEQQLTGS